MSLENVLENSEYRLVFLKAIQLGILYGESDKSNFYKEKIQNEIYSLMKEPKKNNETIKEIKNNHASEEIDPDKLKKQDLLIVALENQKNNILQIIQQLSINYSFNYPKIEMLKTNLTNLQSEIEKQKQIRIQIFKEESYNTKNKLLEESYRKRDQKISVKTSSQKNYSNQQSNENLTNELQNTLSKLSNLIIN